MSQAFTPNFEDQARRIIALERQVRDLKSGVGQGEPTMIKQSTANLTPLTTSFQDVPGAVLSIVKPGRYELHAQFDLTVNVLGAGDLAVCTFAFTGAISGTTLSGLEDLRTVHFGMPRAFGVCNALGPGTIKLVARQTSATPTVIVNFGNGATALMVHRGGPA